MLLTEKKLAQRLKELKESCYRNIKVIDHFLAREDHSGISHPPVPKLGEGDALFSMGDTWAGRDRYLWLETTVQIPEEWANLESQWEPLMIFDFCGYDYCAFEAMLYMDGEPYQGVDAQHAEVFFKKEHFGCEHTITLRLWSGLEDGGEPHPVKHEFRDARLALLNHFADELYYTGSTVLETVELMREEQEEREDLLTALDEAFMRVDWTDKGSTAFYDSVKTAAEYLSEQLARMRKNTGVMVSCVGHTHIDTAWKWRLKHTREKVSRSFSTVLRLMERFPEYLFLHTQPQQYAYIKEDFPQIYEQIRKRIKEGRWEIDGAMWIEPDCNLTSGESLVRQLLCGRRFMLDEFQKEPSYLWLPDAFGYTAALPQILKKSGIKTFMTAKVTWSQYNRMPNDTFWWKGLDGTEILTYFLTTPNPYLYNGVLKPELVNEVWARYREKRLNKDVMITYGYGDGGGGVSREMLKRRAVMDKLPGLPNVKTSTAGDFFKRLHDTVEKTDQPMATWDGELYLEYHRGTFTSQAYNKKMNRFLENLYRKAEWLTAMAAIRSRNLDVAEQEKLTEGWKLILTQQFHDVLPGSSIHEVYEDSKEMYRQAEKIADDVIREVYGCLTERREPDTVFSILNPTAENRSGIVRISEKADAGSLEGKILYAEDGQKISMQAGEDGTWAYVENVPAMGIKYLRVCEAEGLNKEACISASEEDGKLQIITPYYELELNQAGQISALYDRKNGRSVLEEDTCGNVLQLFEDKPLDYDAWDIDMFYYQKMQEVTDLVSRRILENGPCRAVIRQEWKISKSFIRQDMILYAKDGRIDFKTYVDWQETQKLLKAAFPIDIRSTYATYDIQYGNIRRANHSNTSWERAKFEVVGHRFADLSEHDYGVSLINDCKYGYDIHQNVMRLSLLKAAIYPDPIADKGEHTFTYALYPHRSDFVNGKTVQEAMELNQPLEALPGRVRLLDSDTESTVSLIGAHVELDALKKSENGKYLVLRFHEYAGSKGKVKAELGFKAKQICECDLMERPLEDFHAPDDFVTDVKAYEIKTFLILL